MIFVYLVVVLIVNLSDLSPRYVEGINVCIKGNLSGTAIFWYGLLISGIIAVITD